MAIKGAVFAAFLVSGILIGMGVKLTFCGAAQEVTGVNYLLETENEKFLIDCGLFQGSKACEEKNREPFLFNPEEIDILFVTHAHLDHIGRIPKLVREGFNGRIISTPPTRDLAELSLADSLGILTKEAERENLQPIYKEEDIKKTMNLWETIEYDKFTGFNGASVVLRDAGHILGSSMVEVQIDGKRIVFTGDLGNPPTPLLKPPFKLEEADYLVVESTYGDKEHEDKKDRKLKIERAIEYTIKNRGVLMVPTFSIERTQELLFEINDLVENERIPQVPVFLDSPLAIHATEIYKKYENYFNKEARYIIDSGDDIFKFPSLKFTLTTEESKNINSVLPPKIVIAGSGMSVGGRIIHHEKRHLSDPNSTLLLVGFQSAGSLGRKLQDGVKSVVILGEEIPVRARVEIIQGYSAHPDKNGLFDFVSSLSTKIKKVFVVQGEAKAALFFTQKIRDCLGVNAVAPFEKNSFILE